ncbi:MAG: hypothetical protein J5I50_10830 [Chitinophagaceae bacterium]|nr:hypothetical protein [Chitinophagaceae bacterium]
MKLSLKFFPIKDLFYSIFPTIGTYGGYINDVAPRLFPSLWVALSIGLIGSVILAIIFYLDNIRNYKKSLAEVLAIGYFMNFTGRLGKLLKTKRPIEFSFPDQTVSITSDKISVEVGLPVNLNSLVRYAERVEQQTQIVYVREFSMSEPYWLRAKMENGRLVIYEFPRTLFSLSKYLQKDFADQASATKNSREIYSFFSKKIEQLRIEYSSEISVDRLNFRNI